MDPLAFLRSLGCVDAKYRRDRKSKGCKGFKPATLDGIAYHPHSTTFAPDRGYTNADDANLADCPRLLKTIDGVQKAGGLINGGRAVEEVRHLLRRVRLPDEPARRAPRRVADASSPRGCSGAPTRPTASRACGC